MLIEFGAPRDQPRCEEHDAPACATLTVGKHAIPLCRQCVKELSDKATSMSVKCNLAYTFSNCRR